MKKKFINNIITIIKNKHTLFVVFLFINIASLFCQKFYTQVSSNTIPMGQTMEVAFIMENANIRGFTPPAFKDFQVVGGPNQSSSTTIINGNRSSSVSFSYYIVPRHEGMCVIEAASAKTDNSVFNSSQVKINVVKGSTTNSANKGTNQNADPNVSTEDISNSVFIKVITNKSEAYIGEPISATFRLYTDRQLFEVQFPKAASFMGFWKHDIPVNQNQPWTYENINGKRYAYIDVQKVILFPQKTGKAEITPIEMDAVIQQQSKRKARNFYEELFGANVSVNEIPIKLKSKTLSIKVKDFPANQPVGFNGIVGAYTLQSSLDKKNSKVDEPILLKLKISGNGNFQAIEAPQLVFPEEFEAYDPETKENVTLNGSSISGTKSFDYMIVPRQPGIYEIPSSEIVCFNPSTREYYTLKTEPFSVKISGDSSKQKGSISSPKEGNKNDICRIKKEIDFSKDQAFLLNNTSLFYTLYGTPVFLFFSLLLIKRKRDASESDIIGNRQRKASKVALSRLSHANQLMQKNEKLAFFNEINKTMLEYLLHKLVISTAEMSREIALNKMLEKKIDSSLIDRYFALIDHTEIALYSPDLDSVAISDTYNESLDIISSLEEKLR